MNTQTATTMKTVSDLIAFIELECSPVDREARFDSMLDECYSFEEVGGPFAYMSPSSVLKECDPTAYRCGVNDWADGEGWLEIGGENYESDDVEKAREEFLDEMRSDLSDLESELEALASECADSEDRITCDIAKGDLSEEIAAMESRIAELERYTF